MRFIVLYMNCEFCELPEIKERTIARNDLAFAFPTNLPIVPGHLLICPVRHVEKLDDLTNEELVAMFAIMKELKTALINAFDAEGFNHAWNEGEVAGQNKKVPHFHLHILPRKKGDAGITNYEPRKFLYRPGSREKTEEEELKKVAKLIKAHM